MPSHFQFYLVFVFWGKCCNGRHGFCVCSSGLIFFFVKTDVELHPNSESIPLLIDRVSILTGCYIYFLTYFHEVIFDWRITRYKLTCSVLWCNCFERQHDSMLWCFFLQRTNSGSCGPSSSEFWIDFIGPKTRRLMWVHIISSQQALHKGWLLACLEPWQELMKP